MWYTGTIPTKIMTSLLQYGTTLHTAIRTGQLPIIRAYLDEKNAGNTCDLLHLAVSHNQIEVVRLLIIHYSCSVDGRNKKQQTPLHIACRGGHLNMIRMLVTQFQANLTLCDENSDSPLHEAARCGRVGIVKCLINEFSCNPISRGNEGKTILHLACFQRYIKLVEMLMSLAPYKLDDLLMCTDNDENIPLHDAVWGGSETLVRSLIKKYECPMELINYSDQTLLHLACAGGHVEIIKLLITEYKADLNAVDKYHYTPLQKAALLGQSKVISCVMNELGSDAKTTLHTTSHQDYPGVVKYLLELCSDVVDDKGNTPLHLATMSGNKMVVKLLITKYKHCPLCSVNNYKETPFHIAYDKGDIEIIRLMIVELKADLMCTDVGVRALYGPKYAMNKSLVMLSDNPYLEKFNCRYNEPKKPPIVDEIFKARRRINQSTWGFSSPSSNKGPRKVCFSSSVTVKQHTQVLSEHFLSSILVKLNVIYIV